MTKQTVIRITLLAAFGAAQSSCADDIDFNRDVRPILSDKCYFCHGPDAGQRQADLRLDVREDAVHVLETELIDRIASEDPDYRMPPPASKLKLSPAEQETLAAWIEQGARYAKHWAFEFLPEQVDIPEPADPSWCRQPIDHFVLARIEQQRLQPSPAAAPWRWFRRATLDLTGLPPTAEQMEMFLSEVSAHGDAAYQEVVDRLLATPAFGEHMTVGWLDLARYADSYGYQSDKLNTQWPYRDWVVRAFNDNLPYDQFLTWQLAGDLLNEPTEEQRLATAFNRLHRLNNEGGAVFEEWRIENVADRVHTFGTAMLGLTMECCRCHDHKYDPLSMREYYSLSAFFNSIDESGVYDRTEKVPCPSMLLPTPEQAAALESANAALEEAERLYTETCRAAHARFEAWSEARTQPLSVPDLRLALAFDRDYDEALKPVYHPSHLDRSPTEMPELVAVENSPLPRLPLALAADSLPEQLSDLTSDARGTRLPRRAMLCDGERGVTTHGIRPFDRWTPFTFTVSMRETKRVPQRTLIAHHSRGTDCGYNGWDLTLVNGHVESRLYRVWPGNAIGVRTVEPILVDAWHQLSATYDGSLRASGMKLYLNGRPLETNVLRDSAKKSANVNVDHGGELVVGQRFRARGFAGGLIDDVRVFTRALTEVELRFLATGQPTAPTADYFASAIDGPTRAALKMLTDARRAVVKAEEVMHEIPIMVEDNHPRETHLLARGQYDAETNETTRVGRDVPASLGLPFPADEPRNRLGLARWVTDARHPLTARVAVNHFWGRFFTDPLVRTPENFGSQGEVPSHPRLLDWLARDFVNSGWDVKRLCKTIVLSATYRQDSIADRTLAARDPTNQLLARGPAHRLGAEQIRDLALFASGLMHHEIGGPPVAPYQPGEDLWRESNTMSPAFRQSVGASLYRRSLYSVWKRTAPLPNMMAFDTTPREVCTVKRSRTNTPLQALVLLNDVQFVEASRALAAQVLPLESEADRIATAFLRLTGRQPDEREQAILLDLMQTERARYHDDPEAAAKLLAVGDEDTRAGAASGDLAAMTMVCQAILNLDATIWKR